MTESALTVEQLIHIIKATDDEPWGILTGNGFNLSCEVRTDYRSLCDALVDSFSDELSKEEIAKLKSELADETHNFEVWLSKKSKESYIEKIALKAIHRQWLVEFVNACSQDHKQYIFSQSLNDFLNLFQYFFTVNVDPYFYRRCLARKQQLETPTEGEKNSEDTTATKGSTQAINSALTKTVFVGPEADKVREVDASRALKRSYQKELGLLPAEEEKSKEINDGFSTRGNMENKEVETHSHNLFYLHGACHLKIIDSHQNSKIMKKLKAGDEGSLISAIRAEEPETNSAIFAGTSAEKLQKINANEYLKSQYDTFKAIDCKNMVIYGTSLAENDKHVWDAISENFNMQNIYISYHGNNAANVKQRAEQIFSGKKLKFFQSKQFVEDTLTVEEETK